MIPKLSPQVSKAFGVGRNLLLAEVFIRGLLLLATWWDPGELEVPSTPMDLFRAAAESPNSAAQRPLRLLNVQPSANIFNRPVYAVENRADYLGRRPNVDTEANIPLMVETCRGSYDGNEKIRDIASCLKFLAEDEDSYYYLPNATLRASAQDPRHAEYANADGKLNTLDQYLDHQSPTATSRGACHGPIIPYHTYWQGGVTWRVEAFIKSYLFTQNLPCSQLWLWFDADSNPNTVQDTLHDSLFERFLPLVERGDILVKGWNFPSWIPLTDVSQGHREHGSPGVRIDPKVMPFEPAALSDAVRFVMLHLHGGVYLDIDMLLLRDLRPLLLPQNHSFAERWGTAQKKGDYNTAVMSLSAHSELSSYFLLGAVRMGSIFHPRVVGQMAVVEGRDTELLKFNDAAFDPIWTIFEGYENKCTVPCLTWMDDAFRAHPFDTEWSAFDGPPLKALDLSQRENIKTKLDSAGDKSSIAILANILANGTILGHNYDSALRGAGVISDYKSADDRFAPSNRTMENFYRGSYAYHVHNQWAKHPEPSSWLDVMQHAQNEFFAGKETNPYGERWSGPEIVPYDFYPELLSGSRA